MSYSSHSFLETRHISLIIMCGATCTQMTHFLINSLSITQLDLVLALNPCLAVHERTLD